MWLHNGLRWDDIYSNLLQMQCGFYHVPSVIFFSVLSFPSVTSSVLINLFYKWVYCSASVCQNRKQETVIKCFQLKSRYFATLFWAIHCKCLISAYSHYTVDDCTHSMIKVYTYTPQIIKTYRLKLNGRRHVIYHFDPWSVLISNM